MIESFNRGQFVNGKDRNLYKAMVKDVNEEKQSVEVHYIG